MIFSNSRSQQASRRSFWKRRGAFFCACLLAGAALVAISGRTFSRFSIFPTPNAAPVSTSAAQKRALEAKRNRSLGSALAKIDAETVRTWVNRWTSANNSTKNERRLVRIDAEKLAQRHPAWLLADALERGTIAPLAPQIAREINAESPANAAFASLVAPPQARRTLPAISLRENSDDRSSRVRQNAALEGFFAAAAARDALRGRDEQFLSRRALEDAISAAGRGAVSELDLSLMSPDLVLELTNLRLQLLRNLGKTPDERSAVREEIRAIEARYAQILREETARQAARVRAARLEIPLRQRREGLQKIENQARLETRSRTESRRNVALETQNFLRRDFGFPASLDLKLPSAQTISAADFALGFASKPRSLPRNLEFFETETTKIASAAPILDGRVLSVSKRPSPKLVAFLRQRARAQAQKWAQLVAGNWGATRTNSLAAPDATNAALKVLFPTSSR